MRCNGVIKYLLLIFNLIFAVAGIVLLGLGVAACRKVEAMAKIFGGDPIVLPSLTAVMSLLIFIVAVLGCCGAITENDCVLIIFSVFEIQLLIMKIVLAVVFLAMPGIIELIIRVSRSMNQLMSPEHFEVDSMRRGFGAGLIAFGVMELTATVLACCLAKHVRSGLRVGYSRSSDVAMMRY